MFLLKAYLLLITDNSEALLSEQDTHIIVMKAHWQ